MGIIYSDVNLDTYKSNAPVLGGEDTGPIENFIATYNAERSYAKGNESLIVSFDEIFAPIRKTVVERAKVSDADRVNIFGSNYYNEYAWGTANYGKYLNNTLDYIKNNPDKFPEDEFKNLTYDVLEQKAIARSKEKIQEQEEISGRKTFFGGVGEFIGGVAGNWSNVDSLSLFQPEFKMISTWPIVSKMLENSIVNAGVEAVKYPEVKSWSEKVTGKEYGFKQFLEHERDVIIGTVALTGLFEGAIRVPYKKGYRWTKDSMLNGVESLQEAYTKRFGGDAEAKAEAMKDINAIKAYDELETYVNDVNPIKDDAGNIEHQSRMKQISEAAVTKQYDRLPKDTISEVRPIEDIHHFERDNDYIGLYNPNDIKVDAETFQFKAGGDVFGVTERLQGVTKWDPISANTAIIYEKADGNKFIVDGHQRLALAKRIMAEDPTQKIEIAAFPLREVDGVSVEEARVIAAMKNIREGTGTAVDAAKVLKINPSQIEYLPPRSLLVYQAEGLIKLSDEAFRLIVNDTIPAHYGAVVGRIIDDPADQIAVIEMIKRLDPANITQAESIARQMKETGFIKSTQESLFGDEVISESLLLERAKILDAGTKIFKTDKQLFQSLIDNASKIEESGNILNKNSNVTNEEIYAKALQITKTNANVKGPISESLTRLAREFKEGGSKGLQGYARQFADDVRRSIEDGNYQRDTTSGLSSFDTIKAQADTVNPERHQDLDLFNTGIGSKGEIEQGKILNTITKEELQMSPEMENSIVHVDDIDPNTGQPIAKTLTMKEIMDDIAQDEKALNRLKGCI